MRQSRKLESAVEVNRERIDLSRDDIESTERRVEIRCASGERRTSNWSGTAIGSLLDRSIIPSETTHLRVESETGYQCCVPIQDAVNGLLAFTRDGIQLPDADGPRFVAPGIDGARTVKNVTRIKPLSLDPDQDPDQYEEFFIAGDDP